MTRLSHSQLMMWKHCKRQWYNTYILRLPDLADKSYALAGSAMHNAIEHHYKNKPNLVELRAFFEEEWKKLGLHSGMLSDKQDSYWNMVKNAMLVDHRFTDIEFGINYTDFTARIDALNKDEGVIVDWKSSTWYDDGRGESANAEEYREQLHTYAWLFRRRFGFVPKLCRSYYLKYGTQRYIEVHPTQESTDKTQQEMNETRTQMQNEKAFDKCCSDGSKCGPFCPFKEQCFGISMTFDIHVQHGRLMLQGSLDPLLVKGLKKEFSFEDKDAHFIRKNSKWDGIHRLYNEKTQSVGLGFQKRLVNVLSKFCKYKKIALNYRLIDHREYAQNSTGMPQSFVNGMKLYPFQEEAVSKLLREKVGILHASTGSGKTQMAAELVRSINSTALFLVDRKELLTQASERFKSLLGIDIGIIGDGVCDIKPVTVGMVQTISRDLKKYVAFMNGIRVLIIDETHIAAADTVRKVAAQCVNTEYRFGLSATPFREDKKDMFIEEAVGQIVHSIPMQELIALGHATKPTIIFKKYSSPTVHTWEYNEDYENNISTNISRNSVILSAIQEYQGKKILVLTKLVAHGAALAGMVPGAVHLHGEVPKKKRQELYETFLKSKDGILVATQSIASKGLDIKDLGVIINAAAHASDTASIQSLGRVVRQLNGKTSAFYIDFVDHGKFTREHSEKRIESFKKEGHEVRIE